MLSLLAALCQDRIRTMRQHQYELLPLSRGDAEDEGLGTPLPSKSPGPKPRCRPGPPVFVAFALIIGFVIITIVQIASQGRSKPLGLPTDEQSPGIQATSREDYVLSLEDWDFGALPTAREYYWTIRDIELSPDGVSRPMIVINDNFPGLLIRCNEGDTIVVHVENQASNATSIHWHGIYQNGTTWMDGTVGVSQCPIAPGSSFTYEFTIRSQSGTYFYHAHHSVQGSDGLLGPLIIHSRDELNVAEAYDTDRVIIVQDHYHSPSSLLLVKYLKPDSENIEPVPDGALINGKASRDCGSSLRTCENLFRAMELFDLQAGKSHRLRFINAGAFAEFQIQIDEHDFAVTEVDGTDVYALDSQRFHRLNILPAQRYSIVVSTNVSTTWDSFWMRARMVTHCFGEDNPNMQDEVRAIVQYTQLSLPSQSQSTRAPVNPPTSRDWPEIIETECRDLNTSLLRPIALGSPPPSADSILFLRANFEIGAWRLSRGFINQTSWRPNVRSPVLHRIHEGLETGNSSFAASAPAVVNDKAFNMDRELVYQTSGNQVLDVIISNFDDGAHPFHLHGNKFWVLASGIGYPPASWRSGIPPDAVDLSAAIQRDTVTVEAFGWTLLRVVTGNPGVWAFHCHVSWHMEAGLMMILWMRGDDSKPLGIPAQMLEMCEMEGVEKGSGPDDEIWYGDLGNG